METPTILYLNNRYVNSLEELKVYLGSKLNDAQKGELIASFRDEVLYNWLNEGDANEREIAEKMKPICDQHLGNGEVLAKIAELFDVPNSLIADYKFVDHAEYLGCDVLGSDDEQTQHPIVPNNGAVYIKKGVTKCRIVFKFKILAPENDFLSLRLEISPKIENAMNWEQTKLDLVGKKNEIKTIELDINVEKLCKECCLTLSHDNTVVGRVTIDNHENTDVVVEEETETAPVGYIKTSLVARVTRDKVRMVHDNKYAFYDKQGHLALDCGYELILNDDYPDNGEFEYGFYSRIVKGKKHLFYINTDGYRDLGVYEEAIPLREDLVAVKWSKEYPYYGVIRNDGVEVIKDDKYGEIRGISKDGYMVCEVATDKFELIDKDGKPFPDEKNCNYYVVNPQANLVCGYNVESNNSYRVLFYMLDEEHIRKFSNYNGYVDFDLSPCVYNNCMVAKNSRMKTIRVFDDRYNNYGNRYYSGDSYYAITSWKGRYIHYRKKTEYDFEHSSDYLTSLDGFSGVYGIPCVASKEWAIVVNEDVFELHPSNKSTYYEKKCFEDLRVVCNGSDKPLFIGLQKEYDKCKLLLVSVEVERIDPIVSIEIKCPTRVDEIYAVVSYDSYICIHYAEKSGKKETQHALIINQDGKIVEADRFGNYEFLCGPICNQYYYLKDGDLYCKRVGEKEGKVLFKGLHASELYPLGITGNFVVKTADGCRIIDIKRNELSNVFGDFKIPSSRWNKSYMEDIIMDYIYNSQYLPIKNEEGKCGLIDTNGKIIVPCEYDEVEDLNSIFKREGIVVF